MVTKEEYLVYNRIYFLEKRINIKHLTINMFSRLSQIKFIFVIECSFQAQS